MSGTEQADGGPAGFARGSGGSRAADGAIVIGAVAVAALPVLRALRVLVAGRWVPTGDVAVIAARSLDTFSGHAPLLGQASTAGGGAPTHSLGPAAYWLYAPAAALLPARALVWWAAAVWVAVAVVAVLVARRLAGRTAAAGAGLALAAGLALVGPELALTAWNPDIGLVALLATLVLAWAVAAGSARAVPALVAAASLAAQSHLTYAVPAVAIGVVAVTCSLAPAAARRLDRWRRPEPGAAGQAAGPRRAGRWWVVAAVVGLCCWAPPLVQQVRGEPGNLRALLDSRGASGPARGWPAGLRSALGVLVEPWRAGQGDVFTPFRSWGAAPGAGRLVAGVVAAALIAVAARRAVRRRDRVAAGALAVVVTTAISMAAVVAASPGDGPSALVNLYALRWLAPAALVCWLLAAVALARDPLAGEARARLAGLTRRIDRPDRRRRPGGAGRLLGPVVLAALVLVPGAVVGATVAIEPVEAPYWPSVRAVGDAAEAATRPGGRYVVRDENPPLGWQYTPSVAFRVRRAGARPVVAPAYVAQFGDWYGGDGSRCDGVFELRFGSAPAPPGATLLVTATMPPGPATAGAPVRLYLRPAEPGRASDRC